MDEKLFKTICMFKINENEKDKGLECRQNDK